MYIEFPSDTELLTLINNVYSQLKKDFQNKKIHTPEMAHFQSNNFTINLTKVTDEYRNEASLNLSFRKRRLTDLINPNIQERKFQFDRTILNSLKDEFEAGDYEHQASQENQIFYEYFHGDHYTDRKYSPDYNIWVPNFLLKGKSKFIADFIFSRYFERSKFDGAKFQKNTGIIRFMALSPEEKSDLANRVKNLHSKNSADPNHELVKGKVVGKFFYLFGFEYLVTDHWKKMEEYKKYATKRDVDGVVYSFATQSLILIEEIGHFTKDHWHKLETLPNMFELFPFLGEPSHWKITYLIIAPASEIIRNEVTALYKNKNVVFWNLKTFKKHFLSLLSPNLKIKKVPTQGFRINVFGKPPKPPRPPDSYIEIYSKILNTLLGDAIRPIYEY